MRTAIVCTLLVLLTSVVQAASDDQEGAAKGPADKVCDADRIGNTNKYIECLQQAAEKFDADLDVLIARIPDSAKVKDEVLGKDVAPSARRRWQKNFAGLAPAFRAYRDKNCDDYSIAAAGYGMGGLQRRLACIINATNRQIDEFTKRYDLESGSGSREPVSVPLAVNTTPTETSGHCLRKRNQDTAHKTNAKC